MLGYLLARAGVPVIILEKHADFLRDFRGDTVHPSTLQVLDELDLVAWMALVYAEEGGQQVSSLNSRRAQAWGGPVVHSPDQVEP